MYSSSVSSSVWGIARHIKINLISLIYLKCFLVYNLLNHLEADDYLIHLVNPFYSNSNKERFMLSTNLPIYQSTNLPDTPLEGDRMGHTSRGHPY